MLIEPIAKLGQLRHFEIRAIRQIPGAAVAVEPDRKHAGGFGALHIEQWIITDVGDRGDRQIQRARGVLKKLGVGFTNVPPLEVALRIYRQMFGAVDVVLWNLAAYAPVPVPSDMEGVLLVSGFDTNTFSQVETWRKRRELGGGKMATNQNVVLETIRRY